MSRIAAIAVLLKVFCISLVRPQQEGMPLVSPTMRMVPEKDWTNAKEKVDLVASKVKFDHKNPTKPQSRHHGDGDSAASISDFDGYHGAGLAAAMVGLILAAGGGIGGGGILVPIYILIMRFSARYGIPLSNVTILGGALANNAFNLRKRHPKAERPMIDFDLVLLMEPPTIAGAVIGSILNKVLPEFVITTLLVLVLGATAFRTYQSAEKQALKEDKAQEGEEGEGLLEGTATKKEAMAATTSSPIPADGNPNGSDGSSASGAIMDASTQENGYEEPTGMWAEMLKDNGEQYPLWKIGAITLCFLLVVASNMLKLHVTTCGSAGYWVMMMTPVFLTVAMMLVVRKYLLAKSAMRAASKEATGIDTKVEGDVNWDDNTTILYPAVCTLSGLFAGMFGIGGGIVKGPLMIEMGVIPEVSAATAAFMIFFTASSATVTYASFGTVAWDFAGVLFCLGVLCTAVGQYAVNSYIAKTGRASIIVYIIAGIVGLSTVLMGYESGMLAYHDIDEGKVGWGTLCK